MKTQFFLLCFIILMAGCQKHNDDVGIKADFSIGDTLLRVNESVNIINLSDTLSTQFIWDFGDGFKSSEKNPVHSYINPGNYNIKLVIKKNTGDSDSTIQGVRVGDRYVYGIMINSISMTKWYTTFGNWDSDSSGIYSRPDLEVIIQEINNLILFESNVIYNVDINDLPMYFQVPDVKINPYNNIGVGSTGIYLNDNDGAESEIMVSSLLSGVQSKYSNYDKKNHTGEFSVGFSGSSFTVRYKIK